MEKIGEYIIYYSLTKAQVSFGKEMQQKVWNLVEPFVDKTEELDLETICELESLLGENLLLIPTKQQWRKIKLNKINQNYEYIL